MGALKFKTIIVRKPWIKSFLDPEWWGNDRGSLSMLDFSCKECFCKEKYNMDETSLSLDLGRKVGLA